MKDSVVNSILTNLDDTRRFQDELLATIKTINNNEGVHQMLSIISIVLILACALTCTARIYEKKKIDFISGICAAACVGAVVGMLIYHFM